MPISNFVGKGTRLIDSDLPRLGSLIGVGEDEVHAFLDVETNGRGYDTLNRPKMLYEPHRFYALTSPSIRARAVEIGVAYAVQGSKPYPVDSYPHLQAAMGLDYTAALKSASWGVGQVLGSNFVAAGYGDVESFVAAMIDGGEAAQLMAAIDFIKANHLDDDLREHKWAAFARGYNGPAYAKNAYDTKLADTFRKWQAIRDTPWPLSPVVTLNAAINATPEKPATQADVIAAHNLAVVTGKLGNGAATVAPATSWWQRFVNALSGKA